MSASSAIGTFLREPLSPEDLQLLAQVLRKVWGLNMHTGNQGPLEAALCAAAEESRMSPHLFLLEVAKKPAASMAQAFIERCTIGETYFFRHEEHFAAVEQIIVPSILKHSPNKRSFRAWSAGCSTGEEAYSMAASLRRCLSPEINLQVLGTDVNTASLEKARRGVYGRWSGRLDVNLDRVVARRGESMEVRDSIKQWVRFERLNLAERLYPSSSTTADMDLIFCRNVLVYFVPEAVRAILQSLTDTLNPDGYLIVSALNVDDAPASLRRCALADGTVILHKPLRAQTAAAPAPQPAKARRPAPRAVATPTPAPAPEAYLTEAKRLVDSGQVKQAMVVLRNGLSRHDDLSATLLLGLLLANQGSDEAGRLFQKIIADHADCIQAHLHLAFFLQARGSKSEAQKHFSIILDKLQGLSDETMIPGPTDLPVGYVRKMVGRVYAGVNR